MFPSHDFSVIQCKVSEFLQWKNGSDELSLWTQLTNLFLGRILVLIICFEGRKTY